MIKIIFTLTIIYIFTLWSVNAFLWQDSWLNLYNDIEKWMADLKLKNFEYEISGWWKDISAEVNKVLKYNFVNECIKPWLTIKDFELIVYSNDIDILIKNLKEEKWCYYNKSIDIKTLNSIMSIITTMNLVYKQKANNKSDDIYKISRIWIYSDWNLDNSSFDLMSDIEEIDKIIFTEPIPYNWEEIWNFDSVFWNFLAWNNTRIRAPLVTTKFLQYQNNNLNNNIFWWSINNLANNPNISPLQTNNTSKYVCSQGNQNSWFNTGTLKFLIPNTSSWNNLLNTWNIWNNPWINWTLTNTWILSWTWNNLTKNKKKFNVNTLNTSWNWPCNTFFCIKIDFQTYSTNLLWWWKTFSIESYMNTSNGHLYKFLWTSLGQSKMTVNFWELGLKNLQLADMFHMWVMIIKKSPPILKDDKRKPWEYKKRLRKYYKNNGKNYDKQNSLSLYFDKQKEKKTVNNSAELPILTVKQKDAYLKNKQALARKQNKLVENEFDHKILYEDMGIFYEKFIPLESFTTNILNYSDNASTIIKAMNDKPSN